MQEIFLCFLFPDDDSICSKYSQEHPDTYHHEDSEIFLWIHEVDMKSSKNKHKIRESLNDFPMCFEFFDCEIIGSKQKRKSDNRSENPPKHIILRIKNMRKRLVSYHIGSSSMSKHQSSGYHSELSTKWHESHKPSPLWEELRKWREKHNKHQYLPSNSSKITKIFRSQKHKESEKSEIGTIFSEKIQKSIHRDVFYK